MGADVSHLIVGEALATVARIGAASKTASRLELIKKSHPNDHAARLMLRYIVGSIVFVSIQVIVLLVTAFVRQSNAVELLPLFVLLFVIGFPIALPTMLLLSNSGVP